ncbi:hypothetical protein [Amycolatopsis sp. WGS_07]|uniref:hypothetical protein n=1 Tax=Amycolatopsis sp. WGS_07 TaxID=3076764 RepID=UPI0038733A77
MFVAFIAAIGFIVLLDVGIATSQSADWWAAWGQWVGGIGSIAAAAVAAWVAVEGWRKSDEQAKQQAKEVQKLRREELASRFAVWVEPAPVTLDDVDRFPASEPISRRARIMYNNVGGLPIYDVEVTAMLRSGDMLSWTYPVCAPTTEPEQLEDGASTLTRRLIRELRNYLVHTWPNETDEERRKTFETDEEAGLLYFMRGTKLAVQFTDSNGYRWFRAWDGNLSPSVGN